MVKDVYDKWHDVGRIASLERLRNSVNGNPRYMVVFTNGVSHRTEPDSSLVYGITNPDMQGEVQIKLNGRSNITHMRPAPAPEKALPEIPDVDSEGDVYVPDAPDLSL